MRGLEKAIRALDTYAIARGITPEITQTTNSLKRKIDVLQNGVPEQIMNVLVRHTNNYTHHAHT